MSDNIDRDIAAAKRLLFENGYRVFPEERVKVMENRHLFNLYDTAMDERLIDHVELDMARTIGFMLHKGGAMIMDGYLSDGGLKLIHTMQVTVIMPPSFKEQQNNDPNLGENDGEGYWGREAA